MVKESAPQCDKNLTLSQILQNITFLVEALFKLCVSLIPISPVFTCIGLFTFDLAYIERTLLSWKTMAFSSPRGHSPGHLFLDISPDISSRTIPLTFPPALIICSEQISTAL